MFKSLKERAQARRADSNLKKENKESGVSGIIELVIVLVILGILTAILLPTFLGTTSTAKNKSAESNLSTSITDLQSAYANNSAAFSTTSATLVSAVNSAEPGLTVTAASATPVTTGGAMTVQAVSVNQVIVGVYSLGANNGSGGCIYASINNGSAVSTGAQGGAGVQYGVGASGAGCQTLSAAPTTTWGPTPA